MSFLGSLFDNLNLGKIGSIGVLGSSLINMFATQAQRRYQVEQVYNQADFLQKKANEENLRYKMLSLQKDIKLEKEIKDYASKTISSGFKLSGSVLENIVNMQNLRYNEKSFEDQIRESVVSSLEESSYNYERMGKRAERFGYISDISQILYGGVLGYQLSKKYF